MQPGDQVFSFFLHMLVTIQLEALKSIFLFEISNFNTICRSTLNYFGRSTCIFLRDEAAVIIQKGFTVNLLWFCH